METPPRDKTLYAHQHAGLMATIFAFVVWGVFPIYFKLTDSINPIEILAHRIVWSVVLGAVVIQIRQQWQDIATAISNTKTLAFLGLATLCIGVNWGLYIWAVQNDLIFQASLGYYINPMIFVAIGTLFLGETLSRLKLYAVLLASFGVGILTFYGGQFPWVAIVLTISWTGYTVIRKQVDVGAMPGLFIETAILFLPCIFYLVHLNNQNALGFANAGIDMKALLMFAGPITVLPLLAFTFGAKRLTLITVGFLQFIGPTLQFCMGLLYGEELTNAHIICFAFIWVAVAIFTIDGLREHRRSFT